MRPWICLICGLLSAAAFGANTVTYICDALGRLTNVQSSGGPSSGITRSYGYDATDNRTSFQSSGASSGGSVTITPTGAVANATSIGTVGES